MKETHYKLKHRVTALFAAAVMLCSMLPGAAFAEEPTPQPTEETVQMEQQTEPSETDNGQTDASSPDPGEDVTEATPETAEEQPAEEEIPAAVVGAELYTDLPNAPIGSYIGSEGLPVATGETKIGICEWPESQLEETSDSYLTAAALDNDGLTMAAPLLDGADYAFVPILAQVEYPADGSALDLILPDGVTLLDYYGAPAEDAESLLHNEYSETSAAVLGVYVQADADFTAQLVYTAPDGSTLTKTLQVTIDRNATAEYPFPDSEITALAERPTPAVTSGKITKVAKVNGTWLIWFNGEPAYCCTHGANGQPAGCPTYTYVNTSTVGADQCIPGDHYGNQIRIWGGLNQLALSDAEDLPAVFSADEGEETSLLDFCASIYDDVQMYIIENFPESTAAEIYLASADELLNGVETYASARGYYTYIYNPGRAGWQTVALIGPEIGEEEPEPEPVVQEYYASWEAPAQTASGSFDFSYGIRADKIQLKTQEKVDGATIEIEPITKSGSIDGGSWSISPAGKQTVTTSGHTVDDNYQKNGGDAAASWSLHYAVTKTSGTRNGQVGPFTTQEAADAAANSARDAAMAELQGEAQNAVNNAIAAAKAQLGSIQFRYEESTVPYGFGKYWGTNGSSQTISVPANTNNDYVMKNDEWSLQVNLKKTDSETGSQIAADAQYEIYQWDVVTGKYQPTGGYNTYSVQRQGDGTYAVINSAAYATTDSMRHTLYYTQRNQGNRTLWYAKGDVVAVVTTGNGSADIATFAPARTKATYDFLSVIHDGTIGEVSVTLPLGSYHIEETKPPYGYVGTSDSYDVTFVWDAQLNDVVMATSIAKYDGAASSQSFEVVRSKDANADFIEQQTLKFYNDREKAKVGVYKVDRETGKYLAGAVFNLYTADDIYSVDGKLLFAAGELVATSPETGADGYTYFDCDIPIRGEYYGSSIRKDATTNSGNYIVKELRAPLGYYVNEEPMEVTFTYDGQAIMVLDNTCSNKPTEMWVSKRDLTNDEELPGATLAIKDTDGNTVTTWVSTDEPHRVTGLHFGESYTLTEIRAAGGYALANDITFRLIQKFDRDGNPLEECEVYYLTTKNILFWKWDDWKLLDDATVIMQDDITKVQISKKDLTTNEELPGAELIITDEKGSEIDRWISTDAPHYMEKLPAGKYTLTEVTAPDGYAIAERMEFEVLPNGEVQTFEMFDDTIKVKISKVDITTNEELPGAELVIKDKDGTEIDRWISTNGPHYVEKMPAGDYTLTEITAPNGYKVAESIDFTVLPTGEMQTVVMKDAREDTPTPTPDNTPTPDHTPQPTPNTTPAPTPVPAAPTATPTPLLTIPKTGDNSSLGLLLAIAGISLAGLAVLVHKSARRKDIAPRDDDDEDTED